MTTLRDAETKDGPPVEPGPVVDLDLDLELEAEMELLTIFHVPGRLPSWNTVLAMGHWERARFKVSLQRGFLSALRACGSACSMRTISARNTTWTAADTLASYLTTPRRSSGSRRSSEKPAGARPSIRRSRSIG